MVYQLIKIHELTTIWADCSECRYFLDYDGTHGCNKFGLVGLPENYIVGTTKKCCSFFSSNEFKYTIPDISKMEEGVLYFYSPDTPNRLIEDIDL